MTKKAADNRNDSVEPTNKRERADARTDWQGSYRPVIRVNASLTTRRQIFSQTGGRQALYTSPVRPAETAMNQPDNRRRAELQVASVKNYLS